MTKNYNDDNDKLDNPIQDEIENIETLENDDLNKKNKNKPSLFSKLFSSKKKKIDEELNENEVIESNINIDDDEIKELDLIIPNNCYIGYTQDKNKSNLKKLITNYTSTYFENTKNTVFSYEKYKNGYLYEIHDGDINHSYLDTVIDKLNSEDEIVIGGTNKKIRVYNNKDIVKTYYLNESSEEDAIYGMKERKMSRVYPTGFSFFIFSLSLAALSFMFTSFSIVYKYKIVDKDQVVFQSYNPEYTPYDFFKKKMPSPDDGSYVERMYFLESSGWKYDLVQVEAEFDVNTEISVLTSDSNLIADAYNEALVDGSDMTVVRSIEDLSNRFKFISDKVYLKEIPIYNNQKYTIASSDVNDKYSQYIKQTVDERVCLEINNRLGTVPEVRQLNGDIDCAISHYSGAEKTPNYVFGYKYK